MWNTHTRASNTLCLHGYTYTRGRGNIYTRINAAHVTRHRNNLSNKLHAHHRACAPCETNIIYIDRCIVSSTRGVAFVILSRLCSHAVRLSATSVGRWSRSSKSHRDYYLITSCPNRCDGRPATTVVRRLDRRSRLRCK